MGGGAVGAAKLALLASAGLVLLPTVARADSEWRSDVLALTDSMIRDAVRDTTVMDTVHELRRVGSDQVIPLYEQLVADEACGAMKEGDKGLEEPLRVDVCHRVIEETFYNLIQEALHGELRLDRPPRVVLNRE